MATIEEVYVLVKGIKEKVDRMDTAIYGNGSGGLKEEVVTVKNDILWVKRIGGKVIWFITSILAVIIGWLIKSELFSSAPK